MYNPNCKKRLAKSIWISRGLSGIFGEPGLREFSHTARACMGGFLNQDIHLATAITIGLESEMQQPYTKLPLRTSTHILSPECCKSTKLLSLPTKRVVYLTHGQNDGLFEGGSCDWNLVAVLRGCDSRGGGEGDRVGKGGEN